MLPDCRVLDTLAVEMDVDLFTQTPEVAAAELGRLGAGRPTRGPARYRAPGPASGRRSDATPTPTGAGSLRLASWRQLLDGGALLIDEPELAGTARPPKIRLSTVTARRLGLVEDAMAGLEGPRGSLHLPVELADLPDDVVWAPARVAAGRRRGRHAGGPRPHPRRARPPHRRYQH